MRVVHDPHGARRVLATEVDMAETMLEQSRGLMFRRSIPDDYALVFTFDPMWPFDADARWPLGAVKGRFIHMLFVAVPIDVVWVADDEVRQVKTLRPWRSVGYATADTVLELPAGAADDVEVGDTVVLDDE
jgi:uncharacterized membrane protein (UPF0127 family)